MRWLAGALGPLAVALLLIPAGRAVAWIGLLVAAVLAVEAADLWHRRRLRVATVEADQVRRRRRSLDV